MYGFRPKSTLVINAVQIITLFTVIGVILSRVKLSFMVVVIICEVTILTIIRSL